MSLYSAAVLALSPINYYRLGETSGTTAVDQGSAGNTGNYSGGFTLNQTGCLAYDTNPGVALDGASGMIQAGPVPLGVNCTISVWVRLTVSGHPANQRLVCTRSGSNDGVDISVQYGGPGADTILLDSNATLTTSGPTTLVDGLWHNVVVVYVSATVTIYQDGLSIYAGPSNGGAILPSFQDLNIGSFTFIPTAYLLGEIDEVALFNTSLTQAQVLTLFQAGAAGPSTNPYPAAVLAASPVAYYRMGEIPLEPVMVDSTPHFDNGAYLPSVITEGVAGALSGDPNTAITFAGANGGVDGADGGTGLVNYPGGRTTISVEAWIKYSALLDGVTILGWYSGGNFQLGTDGAGLHLQFTYDMGGPQTITAASSYATGTYHQVVMVFDSVLGATLYVDGASVGHNATGSALDAEALGNFTVDGTDDFPGTIDEISIYSTALSATTVMNHFKLGKGQSITTPKGGSKWWRQLDE